MPAPAAPPPAAPAAPAAPPTNSGSALPPSTGVINLGAPPAGPAAEPPKAGTPRAAFTERLRKVAKPEGVEPETPAAPKAPEQPKAPEADPAAEGEEDTPEPESIEGDIDPEGAPNPEDKPASAPAAKVDGRKTKVNPWKLADEHKARAAKAEAEASELRKLLGDPEARKSEVERFTKLEARNKELEQAITFLDYKQSSEFVEKYEKPYLDQWHRSMAELKEIVITDPLTGAERNLKQQDLLELVNLPLNKARARAIELYGESAQDVMDHRGKIRDLNNAQLDALEKAKKDGTEHIKAKQQQTQSQMAEAQKLVGEAWEKTNNDIIADAKIGHYFRPIEGDADANTRLEKGYKFVDEAFAVNPMDPKLSKEERAQVVKKHAAVRHRAAAFGRMRYMLEKMTADKAALEKKLAEYESSTPDMAGRQPNGNPPAPDNPRAAFFGKLHSLAK